METLTGDEIVLLEAKLKKLITTHARDLIDNANARIFVRLAYDLSGSDPKAFRRELKQYLQVANRIIKEATKFVNMLDFQEDEEAPTTTPVISVQRAVRMFLSGAIKPGSLSVSLGGFVERCKKGLDELEPKASKRGQKGYVALSFFLQSMFAAARSSGASTRLPYNATSDAQGYIKPTSFLDFVIAALEISGKKVRAALASADPKKTNDKEANSFFEIVDKTSARDNRSVRKLINHLREAKRKSMSQIVRGGSGRRN